MGEAAGIAAAQRELDTLAARTNTYPGGYFEDRGFNWFSGI